MGSTLNLDRIFFYWLCAYAIAVSISQATMSIAAGGFVVGCLIYTAFSSKFRKQVANFASSKTNTIWTKSFLFFLGALTLSLLGTWIFPVTYNGVTAELKPLEDFAKYWYFLIPIFLGLLFTRQNSKRLNTIIKIWLGFIVLLSLLGWIEALFGFPSKRIVPNSSPEKYHVILFMKHHLSIANTFIFAFFVLLDQWRISKSKRFFKNNWILAASQFIVFGALILTYSRMLWIVLPLSLLAWLVLYYRSWKLLVLVIFALIGGFVAIKDQEFFVRRMHSTTGVQPRIDIWNANWKMIQDRPLTGLGFRKNHQMSGPKLLEMFPERKKVFAGHAHSMPIDLLAGSGIIGFAAWIYFWLAFFKIGWSLYLNKSDTLGGAGMICAGLTFLGNGVTQVNFWEGKVLHQFMWSYSLMIAMYFLLRTKAKKTA